VLLPVALFAAAIVATVLGILPAAAALTGAVVGLVFLRAITMREVYEAVDWQVIVLLAAMIPVGGALETTGGAQVLADTIALLAGTADPHIIIALVLILTMTLSDIMNNAATAVVMAPVALGLADTIGVSGDPMLMAVAVGASSAFLTPIGHQNNLLVMGPGGYKFGDYWRMGLPLEVLLVALGVWLIPVAWPFY
jgi:di/tricarboxylate transporter